MEAKKSPKANLESKKFIFTQIGIIIALVIVLYAFEWKSYDKREIIIGQREVIDVPIEIIPLTEQKIKPPPPPPKQLYDFNIVDDDEIIDDDEIDIDVGADETTEVQEYVPPALEDEIINEEQIFVIVDEDPSFPGGESALYKYLGNAIDYPIMARETGVQGMVYLTFVVEKDGSITDLNLLRGIGGGCDEEAIRVVKTMPKWNPGKQYTRPVRVRFTLPVRFVLQR